MCYGYLIEVPKYVVKEKFEEKNYQIREKGLQAPQVVLVYQVQRTRLATVLFEKQYRYYY